MVCVSPNGWRLLAVLMCFFLNFMRLLCVTQVTKVEANDLLMQKDYQCCWHRRTKFIHGDDPDSSIHGPFANALNPAMLGKLLASRLAVTS